MKSLRIIYVVQALIVLIILTSCTGFYPNKLRNKYHLKKRVEFTLPDSALLRCDGVYVNRDTTDRGIFTAYIWFFEDGKCFFSNNRKGAVNYDSIGIFSLNYGEKTFYQFKDNEVKIESWGGNYVGYTFYEGIVSSNTFTLLSHKPRGVTPTREYLPEPFVYVYEYLTPISSKDW
jgi:hypothetical protein